MNYKNKIEEKEKKIEELQEYIFEIKQRLAGVDLEVENKVKIIADKIKQQTRAKCEEEALVLIGKLK